jgi:hypothetical protein
VPAIGPPSRPPNTAATRSRDCTTGSLRATLAGRTASIIHAGAIASTRGRHQRRSRKPAPVHRRHSPAIVGQTSNARLDPGAAHPRRMPAGVHAGDCAARFDLACAVRRPSCRARIRLRSWSAQPRRSAGRRAAGRGGRGMARRWHATTDASPKSGPEVPSARQSLPAASTEGNLGKWPLPPLPAGRCRMKPRSNIRDARVRAP